MHPLTLMQICFLSCMTLVQKHVVGSVLKFKPETFTPSSRGFCYLKTKGEIFNAWRQMRLFITLVLRIFMTQVKTEHTVQ